MDDTIRFKLEKNGGFYQTNYLMIVEGGFKFRIEMEEGKLKITKIDSSNNVVSASGVPNPVYIQ
ncbi:hypothetical protein [Flavivirga rizhaonensis]|uniref:Uncharacterized protein n=1 Tax=Flavivirga rizhaonensis TaxID=2559571 RepID=A0A4S1DZ56_9FLAO|nr:hypothetical protein [Flavivirga rizhaonensis]TGV03601.1 hypothetical protein EM932_06130 [Flavivirga rizhaonensis]